MPAAVALAAAEWVKGVADVAWAQPSHAWLRQLATECYAVICGCTSTVHAPCWPVVDCTPVQYIVL
jgi:hypothetical protein